MAGPRQPEPSQSNGISPSFSERVYEMHIQTWFRFYICEDFEQQGKHILENKILYHSTSCFDFKECVCHANCIIEYVRWHIYSILCINIYEGTSDKFMEK